MKLIKYNTSNSIAKIAFVFLLTLSNIGSAFAQNTTGNTGNNQGGQNTVEPPKTVVPTANRTTTQEGRTPATTTADAREIALTPAETAAIEAEEKTRLRREAEIAADEAKSDLIKRTFGSSIFANSKFDLTQAINIATPNNYVLGPGDKLSVTVYGYSQNNQEVTVNPDGFVLLEKSGLVNVNGLNISSAEAKIKAALSKTYPNINTGSTFVKISLTGFRTIKVRVTGEVIAPGTYTLTTFSSVMTALYASGGPNEIGTYREINLVRGNKVISKLDIYDYIVNGYSSGDLLLKDQDIIHVGPFKSRVAITGETKRTGLFEPLENDKISDLLRYAGGFNQYAFQDLIKVYRNTANERMILNVAKADFTKTPALMGDSLIVDRVLLRIQNVVSVEGAVFRGGEYSLDSNPTLTALIKSASGLKEESLQGRINILRTNDDLSISNISVNLFDIQDGTAPDVQLKRLDRVIVPSLFELTEQATIRVQGAINNPDAAEGVVLPFIKDMSIKDAIVKVGGLTEAASLSRIEVVRRKRNIDPTQADAQIATIIPFNMRPDLTIVEGQENIKLLPFDEIIVRKSPNYEAQKFVQIKGEVLFPGKYGIEYKDENIASLIRRAGGTTDLAYLKGAQIIRKTYLTERQRLKREETLLNLNITKNVQAAKDLEEEELDELTTKEKEDAQSYITEEIGIDFEKLINNPNSPEYNMILQDGDEIIIPKRLETVRVEGEILYPTSVKFKKNDSFLDYISQAGGFTKKSAKGSAYVRYANGSVDRTRKFLFVRFHPTVQPGSEIFIPAKNITPIQQFTQFSTLLTTISGTLMTVVTIISLSKL